MTDILRGARGYEPLAALLFTTSTFLVGPHLGLAAALLTTDGIPMKPKGWLVLFIAAGAWTASLIAILSSRSTEPKALKRVSTLGWCLVSLSLLVVWCALVANTLRG